MLKKEEGGQLPTRYQPAQVEQKIYAHWETKGYFHSIPDDREPYTIVIPPPNVTGILHMGHMLNNTIQDILIRKARMDGKNACWVPGTDHASIATEAKVVQLLREKGIKKSELSREEFLKYAFEWKDKYGGIILEQLKKLGASCDWQRTRFTMEPKLSDAVLKVFVDLYQRGWIYRKLRMTNWDPEAKTALSNEEVIYSDESARLYYLKYPIKGTQEHVIIATQRPETIMADSAIAVHPEDERYLHLKGKMVIIPLINKEIPIIFDTYVDREFGTGALKITPAHDQNDHEIGERHHLPCLDILNEDGTLNEDAQILIGLDRFIARKKIIKLLEADGFLEKQEDYTTRIGRSERTKAVVEPRLTLQWFCSMKEMSQKALSAVHDGSVRFFPPGTVHIYEQWLDPDKVKDWCISRQLWWGQQIPAWFLKEKGKGPDAPFFVALNQDEALEQARKLTQNPNLTISDLIRDEDVVDTWFSSWLWPLTVFDGFIDTKELNYYYPTNVLVTGWDIIYFWVARMIMAGYTWGPELLPNKKEIFPFKDVYFTGMVRDNQRRKMSKSLGNSPDALELLEKYGADGVRYGLMSCSAAGNDIIFDAPMDPSTKQVKNESKLCEQGLNFCNKLWNAMRLIRGWQIDSELQPTVQESFAISWIENKFYRMVEENERRLNDYRLSEIIKIQYSFIWDDFCSWYLEMIKPAFGQPISTGVYQSTISIFEKICIYLHPFMPFITETIWHQLKDRKEGEDCMLQRTPIGSYDEAIIQPAEICKEVISHIREIRNNQGISPKDQLELFYGDSTNMQGFIQLEGWEATLIKLANVNVQKLKGETPQNVVAFICGTDQFFVLLNKEMDVEQEIIKLKEELKYMEGFVVSVQKKLSNEKFVASAPVDVVQKEKQKLDDGLIRVQKIREQIESLQ